MFSHVDVWATTVGEVAEIAEIVRTPKSVARTSGVPSSGAAC